MRLAACTPIECLSTLMRHQSSIYLIVLALSVLFAPTGRTNLILNLKPADMTVAPGGTVEFAGTLENMETANVFLNGDVIILPNIQLTVDDTPFFENSPLFLVPGESYVGPFFDVT